MSILRRTFASFAIASLLWGFETATAQAEAPLLQEGKTQLFQRVLLRSDVPRRSQPNLAGAGQLARALDALYVFERASVDGAEWLRVAVGQTGTGAFWVPEPKTLSWEHATVLTFTTLGGLDRLLIFDDVDSAYDVVESEDPALSASRMREQAIEAERTGGATSGSIVALGPELGVDLGSNFYMFPILETEEAVFDRGGFVNLLRVAIAKPSSAPGIGASGSQAGQDRGQALQEFRAGIVFAVDTTVSMGAYFDPVRQAVLSIYDQLNQAGAEGGVSFGLVGFRDAVTEPGIEYRTKTFVDLPAGANRDNFLNGLAQMHEAQATTRGFNEDSFAGVYHSLDQLDWSSLDARIVVLITDAGPRLGVDRNSGTGLGARQLANQAKELFGAHIATLHLTTSNGEHTHAMAREHYTELSRVGQTDPLYFAVEDGSPRVLQEKAQILASSVANAIALARQGQELDGTTPTSEANLSPENAEIAERTLRVVKSMQLDFLGQRTSAVAPDVFEGWIADRDFTRRSLQPVEIRLLVSRKQLSDLYEGLNDIIREGEDLEPLTFFQRVLAASTERMRAQGRVATGSDGRSIADAALLGELLEGLPYRSQIMSMDSDTWLGMGIASQQEIIDVLYEKVSNYEKIIATVDNWVRLSPEQTDDEAVYPMLLEDLP